MYIKRIGHAIIEIVSLNIQGYCIVLFKHIFFKHINVFYFCHSAFFSSKTLVSKLSVPPQLTYFVKPLMERENSTEFQPVMTDKVEEPH